MQPLAVNSHPIVERARIALALNRTPGYHFCGNFFNLLFGDVDQQHSVLHMDAAPQSADQDGQLSLTAFAMLADMGLATGIRFGLDQSTRLATVAISLQMTGAPRTGRLSAASQSQGFIQGVQGKQGLSQTRITADKELVCIGQGAFMILPVPGGKGLAPIPWVGRTPPQNPQLDLTTLTEDEAWVLARVEQAVKRCTTEGGDFVTRFLGLYPEQRSDGAFVQIENGAHIANRVKHVQGGIVLALGMETAAAALGAEWLLSGVTATYISPGEGDTISATSSIVHRGRMTAVVRTQVLNSTGRQALEVLTTHARRV
jgi:acyl-coenzyme A thioesterase PaaI-like protein